MVYFQASWPSPLNVYLSLHYQIKSINILYQGGVRYLNCTFLAVSICLGVHVLTGVKVHTGADV